MTPILAYATTPDTETARRIARALLDEKLIACANFWPGMTSLYPWQGRLEESPETVLILKTSKDLWDRLATRFRELHPYETPCLLEIPIGRGLPDYLAWMRNGLSAE